MSKITIDYFDNYVSYDQVLKSLRMKRTTLQDQMRNRKIFQEPGDTIILPNKKRVFLRSSVEREIENILKKNGVRRL